MLEHLVVIIGFHGVVMAIVGIGIFNALEDIKKVLKETIPDEKPDAN